MRTLFLAVAILAQAILAAPIPAHAASAADRFDFHFGDDVTADVQASVREAANTAAKFYAESLGASLPDQTQAFVSGDAKFLARSYAKHTGAKLTAQIVKDWTSLRENAATYGAIFVRTNSKSFNMSNGNSLQGQRTRIFVHELFHVLQYDLVGPKAKKCCAFDKVPVVGPTWLMEGSAQYLQYFNEGPQTLSGWRNWAQKQKQASTATLQSFETRKGMDAEPNAYDISALAVEKLANKAEITSLVKYWREIDNGRTWQRAFKDAFDTTPAEFYAAF